MRACYEHATSLCETERITLRSPNNTVSHTSCMSEHLSSHTGLNTMMGEAAKSIQESGGHHVGGRPHTQCTARTVPTPCTRATHIALVCPHTVHLPALADLSLIWGAVCSRLALVLLSSYSPLALSSYSPLRSACSRRRSRWQAAC